MAIDHDIEIFKGKKFSDLCKEIHDNSTNTRLQISILVTELRQLVVGINDAITVVPLIAEYLKLGITNDDSLIRLAAIIQRILSKQATDNNSPGGFTLSEEEKKQLMDSVKELSTEHNIDISGEVSKVKEKLSK